jgi:5-formyltetrahydrofolate cyclo-ligase
MSERGMPCDAAPSENSNPGEDKKRLRARIRAARDALDPLRRAQLSEAVTARLLTLAEFQRASCVLAYLSFGSEFETHGFLGALRGRGCALVLPRVDRAQRRLALYRVSDLVADTVPGVWGIREPDPGRCPLADLASIDAVLAPGMAFTPRCDRLGYGGGFYDKLLRDWKPRPPIVAAAFRLQVVEEMPLGPEDQPVDRLVTEGESYLRESRPEK